MKKQKENVEYGKGAEPERNRHTVVRIRKRTDKEARAKNIGGEVLAYIW